MSRIIGNPVASMVNDPESLDWIANFYLYIVPKGHYLVICCLGGLGLCDLGYVSDDNISSDRKPANFWTTPIDYTMSDYAMADRRILCSSLSHP